MNRSSHHNRTVHDASSRGAYLTRQRPLVATTSLLLKSFAEPHCNVVSVKLPVEMPRFEKVPPLPRVSDEPRPRALGGLAFNFPFASEYRNLPARHTSTLSDSLRLSPKDRPRAPSPGVTRKPLRTCVASARLSTEKFGAQPMGLSAMKMPTPTPPRRKREPAAYLRDSRMLCERSIRPPEGVRGGPTLADRREAAPPA